MDNVGCLCFTPREALPVFAGAIYNDYTKEMLKWLTNVKKPYKCLQMLNPPPKKNNKTQKTADAPASDYKQL